MPSELEEAARRFRAELLRNERGAASAMVQAYGQAWRQVSGDLAAMQRAIADARAAGMVPDRFVPRQPGGPVVPRTPGTFSPSWLYRDERYQALQRQIETEMARFSGYADAQILAGQRDAIAAGLEHSSAMVEGAGGPEIRAVFNRLPAEAVQDMVGFMADGSPLSTLLDNLGPMVSRGVRDALTTSIALGLNPRQTARAVCRAFGMGLARALVIARTEQLRAYREASRRNYAANSDVVMGWQWLCACDRRSCASCWAMHGSIHGVKETLDDHPNGRCAMVPVVKGLAPAIGRNGPELFAELPEADQRYILGQAAQLAYRAGELELDPDHNNPRSIVGRQDDPQWGTMRFARSLQSIVGRARAQQLMREARA